MKTCNYIYLIRNLINDKIYIGKHSTNNLQDCYFGSGKRLHLAYKKYGKENFKKELLCMCVDDEELNEMEIYYISKFNSTDRTIGYNLTFGGDGGVPTEEVKQKKSESLKGRKLSEETKAKISESMKERIHQRVNIIQMKQNKNCLKQIKENQVKKLNGKLLKAMLLK